MTAMTDLERETLWVGAFRYHLGRQTFAVGFFVQALLAHLDDVPERAKVIIGRDLGEAWRRDEALRERGDALALPLGSDIDRREWGRVRVALRDYA